MESNRRAFENTSDDRKNIRQAVKKDRVTDMTKGKPLKLIARFMLPLLAGNLLQQFYNLVDAAIVGQTLGTGALASVGSSSSVQFLVLGFCIGSCAGFGIPVAREFGAKNYRAMREYVWHSILLSVLIAVAVTGVTTIFCADILHLLEVPEDIFQYAYDYLLVIFWGIPFTILYNLTSSLLRAVGDSRTPFLFLALSAALNIFLDLFCILVLHLGVSGAALATIVSQAISGVLCTIYILRRVAILLVRPEERGVCGSRIKDLMLMALPMGLQFSITAIGSMVMQAANNSLGSVYVSGFTAGMKIKQFALGPFDALATAVSTFASQNYGASLPDRIKKGFREGIVAGILYGIIVGLVMIFFGRNLAMLFVPADESKVLDAAWQYQRCMGYFLWVLGILNVSRMTAQGLGHAALTVVSGVIEMIARCFVSFVFVPVYHYDAICWADQTAWISASIFILPTALHLIGKVSDLQKKK